MNGFELVRLQPEQVKKTGDTITGNLTAQGNANFVGPLQGNATSATRLQTARNIQVGNTTRAFNGTSNISFSLADIGASASNHNHDNNYLKLTGGTMSGSILLNTNGNINIGNANNRLGTLYTGVIDFNNSIGIYPQGQYVLAFKCGRQQGGQAGELFYDHNGQAYHFEPKWSGDVALPESTGLGKARNTWRDVWTHMGHNQTSDITKKENVKKIVSDEEIAKYKKSKLKDISLLSSNSITETVKQIQPITFDYKGAVKTLEDGTIADNDEISKVARQLGISAQDLEALNPTLFEYIGVKTITENEDGDLETRYSIKTLAFTNMLLVALQETMKEVETLKEEVKELKAKI